METKKNPITVYAESTPNPAAMKFVANKLLIENGQIAEFTSSEAAKSSPLASQLFNFPFITGVFISANFITVTKNNLAEWIDITLELREFVRDYLSSGKEIIGSFGDNNETITSKPDSAAATTLLEKKLTGVEKRIEELLEEYVRPAVEQDGGAIHFKSFEEGILKVVLKGSCSGCPSSTVTLKAGIQGLFNKMLPEVKEVVAEEA